MRSHLELQFAGEIRLYECYACGKLIIKQRIRKVRLVDEQGNPEEVVRLCLDCFKELVKGNACSQRDSEPQSPNYSYPVATGVIATQPETGSGLEEGIV